MLPEILDERIPNSADSRHARKRQAAWFFERRMRWSLTWRGWLLLATVFACAMVLGLRMVHPFLAVQAPTGANILVIEGWLPDYALRQSLPLIRDGSYQTVVTVGGPAGGYLPPVKDDDTRAYVAMMYLRRAGIDPALIKMVPTHTANRDRTFHFASDFKRWLDNQGLSPKSVDVVTLGVHARRSRLLFEKALGPDTRVGIIALRNEEYDPEVWWQYSEGVKEIIAEFAGYVYVRLFFHPKRPE